MSVRADLEEVLLRIALMTERVRSQRRMVESLTAAGMESWRAIQALQAVETTLSELVVRRDALRVAADLRTLAPACRGLATTPS